MRSARIPAVLAAACLLLASPAAAHTTVTAWDNAVLQPMPLYVLGTCIFGAGSPSHGPLPSAPLHGQAAPPATGSATIGTLALDAYDTEYEMRSPGSGGGCSGVWHFTHMETGGEATLYLASGIAPRLLTVTVSFPSVLAVAQAASAPLYGSCSVGGVSAPVNPADGTCTLTFWGTAGTAHALLFGAEVSPASPSAAAGWSVQMQSVVEVSEGTHKNVFALLHEY